MDGTRNLPEQVHIENGLEFDQENGDQHKKRQMILSKIAEHYHEGTVLDDLNAKERSAIDDTSLNNILSDTYPGVIRELKLESLEKFMISLERGMQNPDFFPKSSMILILNEVRYLGSEAMKEDGTRIMKLLIKVVCDDIERKYEAETPLIYLSRVETQVLKSLRPHLGDISYSETVIALHSRLTESDLDEDKNKQISDPKFELRNIKRWRFLSTECSVPENIKSKAEKLLKMIEDTILDRLPHKYDFDTNVNELNEAEKYVLEKLSFGHESLNPVAEYLRWEVIYFVLSKEFEAFKVGKLTKKHHMPKSLNIILSNDRVPDKTKQMAKKWINIVKDDIERKYDAETPLDHLSLCEIHVLESLPLLSDDTLYPKTIEALYWRQIESGLDEDMDKLVSDPEFEVRNVQRLRLFSTECRVPKNIKVKADQLRTVNENTVIERLPHKYDLETEVDELNEAEKSVLEKLAFGLKKEDPVVEYLRWEVIHNLLSKEFEAFKVGTLTKKHHMPKRIFIILTNDRVPDKTKQMAKQWIDIVKDDIERKYDAETPLDHLSVCEIQVLESLPLLSDDTLYPKTIEALYWRQIESGLDEDMNKLVSDPEFEVHNVQRLRILSTERRVPINIKVKADHLRTMNEDTIIERLPHKYDADTPLNNLSGCEYQVLRSLRPLVDGMSYPKTVLKLHWRIIEDGLDKDMIYLASDPEYDVQNLRFLNRLIKDSRVPVYIKTKVKEVQKLLKVRENALTERVRYRYCLESKVDELTEEEVKGLERLDVIRNKYHPVIENLHWKVTYSVLCGDYENIKAGKHATTYLLRKLDFLSNNERVPVIVKEKAKEIQQEISN